MGCNGFWSFQVFSTLHITITAVIEYTVTLQNITATTTKVVATIVMLSSPLSNIINIWVCPKYSTHSHLPQACQTRVPLEEMVTETNHQPLSTDVKICQDAPRIWGTDLTAWQRNASAEAWGGFPKITKSLSGKHVHWDTHWTQSRAALFVGRPVSSSARPEFHCTPAAAQKNSVLDPGLSTSEQGPKRAKDSVPWLHWFFQMWICAVSSVRISFHLCLTVQPYDILKTIEGSKVADTMLRWKREGKAKVTIAVSCFHQWL